MKHPSKADIHRLDELAPCSVEAWRAAYRHRPYLADRALERLNAAGYSIVEAGHVETTAAGSISANYVVGRGGGPMTYAMARFILAFAAGGGPTALGRDLGISTYAANRARQRAVAAGWISDGRPVVGAIAVATAMTWGSP